MKIQSNNLFFELDEKSLAFTIQTEGKVWQSVPDFLANIELKKSVEKEQTTEQVLYFKDADAITHEKYVNGIGEGILSTYRFEELEFQTNIWIEESTDFLYFEWIPLREKENTIKRVNWPAPLVFDKIEEEAYTLLPYLQGLMIPNTWENDVNPLHFDGQFCSSAAYLPMFSQIENEHGYLAVALTEWDGGYHISHPQAGATPVHTYWLPSLGKMAYKRVLRMQFFAECDYNTICKAYRAYAIETGRFVTLKEKEIRNPGVAKLIGASVVHKGIKKHIDEKSIFYDKENLENNDSLTTFAFREKEIRFYKEKGVEKLYLHLDGWGTPGYDNKHPDILPPCAEAGGWEGMKSLSQTMQECGYVFGIHDQYRDYYFDADTFDEKYGCRNNEGKIFEQSLWAGGHQSYLCASLAPFYVKRNYEKLAEGGLHLDAAYLDVFTCNEPDECTHPEHTMTRRDCLNYRNDCFDYLSSRHIAPSSEEVNDWTVRSLVFCHYAPYSFMLDKPGAPAKGIPLPLFNLVYHECMIIPWFTDKTEKEDYMLYALLNGGIGYLDRDGAYAGRDGAFDMPAQLIDEQIKRCQVISQLHEKVSHAEMVRHEFLNAEKTCQRTIFSNGVSVTINLNDGTYTIEN